MTVLQMDIDQLLLDQCYPGSPLRCPVATAMARVPHLRLPHVHASLITVGTPSGLLHCSTSTGLKLWIHSFDLGRPTHPFTLMVDTNTRHAYIRDDPVPDPGPTTASLGLRIDAAARRFIARLEEILIPKEPSAPPAEAARPPAHT